jgi:ubiquinone/menaquinone biosynthesis C-methylase UbiE
MKKWYSIIAEQVSMTDPTDEYRSFAKNYDLGRSITDVNPAEQQFYERLFTQHGVRTVLDCACGTGRHCYLFSKMGYEVQGSDLSAAMLAQARLNFRNTDLHIELTQCDFRTLERHLKRKFDAVVCLTTSLPHLHEDSELVKALVSMKNVLRDSGIVVVDQGTTHCNIKPERRFEIVFDNEEFSRVFVKEVKHHLQTIHILDIFHGTPETRLEHYTVTYRILLDDDYQRLFTQAGYKNIQILGNWNGAPYKAETSERLIATGEK